MDAEVAIVQRAATVRRLGQDIGFFEWVCWAHVAHANVHMTFGDHMVDLLHIFAPGSPVLSDDAPTHFPIATLVDSTKRNGTSRYSTGEDVWMPQCSIATSSRSTVPLCHSSCRGHSAWCYTCRRWRSISSSQSLCDRSARWGEEYTA
jgi:hypothetical protein